MSRRGREKGQAVLIDLDSDAEEGEALYQNLTFLSVVLRLMFRVMCSDCDARGALLDVLRVRWRCGCVGWCLIHCLVRV
jgi:hypothetical protein